MCGLEPDSSGLRNLHPVPALGGVFALPQLTANTLLPRRQILESQTTLSSLMRKRLTRSCHLQWLASGSSSLHSPKAHNPTVLFFFYILQNIILTSLLFYLGHVQSPVTSKLYPP